MKRIVIGALASLAFAGAAHAEDMLCKGAAANPTDLMVVQAVITPDGASKGGIATFWLDGRRKDVAVSLLVHYDLKGVKGDVEPPSRMTVFSRDPATNGAAWAVVTIAGIEYKGRWHDMKAPATGGTADVPGVVKAMIAAQVSGVEISISINDKSGKALATGKISLPTQEEAESAASAAFTSAATASATKNLKLCTVMAANVNEGEFMRTMHDNDFGMENKASDMMKPPSGGGVPR